MDILYQLQWQVFSVHADGCLQWISGYIYDEPQKENITVIFRGAYPIFQYRQTPAFFRGMDFDFHFMPADSWDYHLTASLIRAKRTDNRKLSSLYPPFHLNHELSWNHRTRSHFRLASGCPAPFRGKNRPGLTRIRILSRTPPAYHLFWSRCGSGMSRKMWTHITVHDIGRQHSEQKNIKNTPTVQRYYAHDMGAMCVAGVSWSFDL